jgi:hypothetical protein
MTEEAFSFRVRAAVPAAARILDMQDLHSLRYARQAGGIVENKHSTDVLPTRDRDWGWGTGERTESVRLNAHSL